MHILVPLGVLRLLIVLPYLSLNPSWLSRLARLFTAHAVYSIQWARQFLVLFRHKIAAYFYIIPRKVLFFGTLLAISKMHIHDHVVCDWMLLSPASPQPRNTFVVHTDTLGTAIVVLTPQLPG